MHFLFRSMPMDPFEMLHAGPLKLGDASLGIGDLAVRKTLLHQTVTGTFETWLVPHLPESRDQAISASTSKTR